MYKYTCRFKSPKLFHPSQNRSLPTSPGHYNKILKIIFNNQTIEEIVKFKYIMQHDNKYMNHLS